MEHALPKRWIALLWVWLAAAAGVAAQPTAATFEVVSVKPNRTQPSDGARIGLGFQPGGRFTATGVTVRDLIRLAYAERDPLPEFRLVGGPRWTETDRFDVDARAGADVGAEQFQPMLRLLLTERFGLVLRNETRELPVYSVVVASRDGRLGPRLQRSEDCTAAGNQRQGPGATDLPSAMCGGGGAPGRLRFGGIALAAALLPALTRELQRVVIDRTGLTGYFDGSLEWAPDPLATLPPGASAPPADAPSIFVALQEQLGLKLEADRAAVQVFVIDSVERPSPN
jgi:uncharacterized protein (TIGR03435 family)